MTAWAESRLLHVTARLQAGAALAFHFPAPLDGILATAARRERLGVLAGSVVDHHVEHLPLARSPKKITGTGSRWVWMATCALLPDDPPMQTRWYHGRFDDTAAIDVAERLPGGATATTTGRYTPRRVPYDIVCVPAVTWWCIGDRDGVRALLDSIDSIGRGVGKGEGRVLDWTVEDYGEPDLAVNPIALTPQGHPARPWPARAAPWLLDKAPGRVETIANTYRPPYWRGQHCSDDNRFARVIPEVIAPWETVA